MTIKPVFFQIIKMNESKTDELKMFIIKTNHDRSPEKSIRQSPEKRAEEISLYVGNIPLSITNVSK